MIRFAKSQNMIIGFVISAIVCITGCGIAPISVRYTPTGSNPRIVSDAPIVKLQVEDAREKKVFFRTILGENDDEGKNGVLRLITPPKEVFEEGFTRALQSAGYPLREDAELVYEVRIKRFLVIDREDSFSDLDSDIMLEVLIKRSEKVLAGKAIFERDTEKMTFGQVWQNAIPPLLNRSLSNAIEKAIQDRDLIAALGGYRAVAKKAAGQKATALPRKQYTLPEKPLRDSSKKVGLSQTKQQTAVKTASAITESRVRSRSLDSDFVINVTKGLPHRFPEGEVKGLWLSSVPLKLDVFAFPKGSSGKFGVFSDWVTNKTDTSYYLGKTPLLAKLKKGTYDILFVHPPIKDENYIPQYRTRRVGPLGIEVNEPICPFIAQRNSVLYAVRGVEYWTEKREIEIRSEDTYETATILFQREDQTVSDMLNSTPAEESFAFNSTNLLKDQNILVSRIVEARSNGRQNLSSQEITVLQSFSLTQEEVTDAEKMLKRTGVWAKKFDGNRSFTIEVKPDKAEWFELRYPLTEDNRESRVQIGFRVQEPDTKLSQTQSPKSVAADTPPTPQPAVKPTKAAKQGHAKAKDNLTVIHNKGKAVIQDPQQDIELYRQAAEQGDADAQYDLAMVYYEGQGIAQDYKQAVKWFTEAAEQGNAEAQNNLGLMYSEGKAVTRDYQKTLRWYTKAAEQGLAQAQNNLGLIYSNGKGVARNYKQAFKWFTKAAEQGYAEAQNNLGSMYNNGMGVTRDYQQAFKWYKKAAEQGNALAQSNLGQMYDTGQGVARDHKQAVMWFRKSAQQGNFLGQHNLALLYYNGRGVSKDYVEAYKWATIAANSDKSADPFKTHLKQYMSSSQIAEAERKAREFTPVLDIPLVLHKAAEQNNIALVKSLIEKGANVNAADQLGWSPLHYAAHRGHKQTAELLLNNGAIVNAKANNDVRPLHLAAEQGQTALAELLLGKGADVNARQVQGWTSLGLAAQKGHLETVKLLLDKGADVNSKSKSGLTPLHSAVSKGYREVVELLLSKGAEVNSKSNNGRTPLHTAAYQNQQKVAELLLSAGADHSVKDIEGKTPIDFATDFGNVTMAKLLAKTTASPQVEKQQKATTGIPTDGVYSKVVGSGGSYKDPINGFFVVQAPDGFKIKKRLDKTKFVIKEGSSHVGEVVPSSFIQFIYANKVFIAVTARKTFTTIEHDFDVVLNGLPKKFPGIMIHRHRFVTIDGVKGGEVLASLHGQKLFMVKYKKHGLDHAITINCDVADFLKFQDEFVAFLCSYRSLKPK